MPIYSFKCTQCDHAFELILKLTEAPPQDCPECGAAVKKEFATTAPPQFRGSGFYSTDYPKRRK